MAANKRLVYFLGFLVVVLPVIVGILVWQLLPGCDADDKKGGKNDANIGHPQTTAGNQYTISTEKPFEDGPWKNLRLPKSVVPQHYNVTLFPDFYEEHDTFYGNITMTLNVRTGTNVIMVHVKYLEVSETILSYDNGFKDPISIKRTFEYEPHEFWVVETTEPLPANKTVYMFLAFNGSLSRSIVGFYKSSYINSITNKSR